MVQIKPRASPGQTVVLPPDADKLVQVMGTQDGGVSRQVLKVVHDHGHEQIQHLEGMNGREKSVAQRQQRNRQEPAERASLRAGH